MPAEPDPCADLPLSAALREHTATAHAHAEQTDFVRRLIAGGVCSGAFAMLVSQHHAIYQALEGVIDRHYREDALVAPFDDPALRRLPALTADLTNLAQLPHSAPVGRAVQQVLPATAAYVARLRMAHSSELVLANHYVRYLGDLSGGQIIARLVQRHYGLPNSVLSFYSFPAIPKPKAYKDAYRARLDSLVLTDAQRARVLASAAEAFRLNQAVFEALSAAQGAEHQAAGVA